MMIDGNSSSSSSWDRLPINIQESILARLPISSLIRLAATSRSLRSLIRSPSFHSAYRSSSAHPRQPLFLFLPHLFAALNPLPPSPALANAYDPVADRWVLLRLRPIALLSLLSDGPLLLSTTNDLLPPATFVYNADTLVYNAFSFLKPPFPVPSPSPSPSPEDDKFRLLAIVSDAPRTFNFKLFMVGTSNDCVRTKVFDSRSRQWTMGIQFPGPFVNIRNAAFLGTSLYCLAHTPFLMPEHLLKLDMEELQWEIVSDALPASVCLHFFVFEGKVFLVGELQNLNGICGAGIWEIDLGTKEWKLYCTMPNEFFSQLCGEDHSFVTADCKGLLCFLGTDSINDVAPFLMCDLAEKKWWWSRGQKRCEGVDFKQRLCFPHVLELSIELLEV